MRLLDTDLEHPAAIGHHDDPGDPEPPDRRRDRAQRRLAETLKTLAYVRRRSRRKVLRVNQVAGVDGNMNLIKA